MVKRTLSLFIVSGIFISGGISAFADEEDMIPDETDVEIYEGYSTDDNVTDYVESSEGSLPEEDNEENDCIIETEDLDDVEVVPDDVEVVAAATPTEEPIYTPFDDMIADEYGPGVHRTSSESPRSGCVFGVLEGSFDNAPVDEILAQINQYRYEACEQGYPDPRDPSRNLTLDDYHPISWSRSLEETAMVRAAESEYTGFHNTLNGDTYQGRTFELRTMSECLSFNYSMNSISNGLASFYKEKDTYLNGGNGVTGHYEAMINPDFTHIGVASICNVTCAEFYVRYNRDPQYAYVDWYYLDVDYTLEENKIDVSVFDSQLIELDRSRIKNVDLTFASDNDMFFVGDQYTLEAMATLNQMGISISYTAPRMIMFPESWTSSDPSVVSIDQDGNIQALSVGTAEIICTVGEKEYTRTIYVNPSKVPGWNIINGDIYYLNDDLEFYTGFLTIDGDTYYLGTDGKRVSGMTQVGRYLLPFDEEGILQTGFQDINGTIRYVLEDGKYATGWIEENGSRFYFNNNGFMSTGLTFANDGYYLFDENGVMQTNCWHYDEASNTKRYFGDDGRPISLYGMVYIEGAWYYNGELKTGWCYIDSKKHYLIDGLPVSGLMTIEGSIYLFNNDGTPYYGWKQIDGSWYYFNSSMATGLISIQGNEYYFNEDGKMYTGWIKIDDIWYYFDNDGCRLTGIQKIEGNIYCLNDKGYISGWYYYFGDCYYFRENGKAAVGWMKIDDKWYYFNEDGLKQDGYCEIGGYLYFLGTDGMLTGYLKDGDNSYYFDENGKAAVGWTKINDQWYYFGTDHTAYKGWNKIGGKWYYFSTSYGTMVTGKIKVDGKYYYMNSNGSMVTGWKKIDSWWYYFGSDGAMAEGWKKISGKWYYFYPGSGIMCTYFYNDNGKRYYLGEFGAMQTGWIKCNDIWYYADSSGLIKTGWQKIGGKWYYFSATGFMVTGTQIIDGKTYTFNSSGVWIK